MGDTKIINKNRDVQIKQGFLNGAERVILNSNVVKM